MALTVQNLRAVGTGVEPASLLPGQICFNLADKILYVGDGSSVKTSFDGTQLPGITGGGWYSMPMDFDSLGDYYVANPGYYGNVPADQQVLTWSSTLNHPIWAPGGSASSQVYLTTDANVAGAPGATVSDKITAAIGVASPNVGDVTIVTGLPNEVYEGLYFYTTAWVKGASYAYPSASQVIYDNTTSGLTPTVQGAIDDLDSGLVATTTTANSALNLASNAVPSSSFASPGDLLVGTGAGTFGALAVGAEGDVLVVSGGTPVWLPDAPGDVTSVAGVSPITVDNTDPRNPVVGISAATTSDPGAVQLSNQVNSLATDQASTPRATKTAYDAGIQGQTDAAAAQATADAAQIAAAAASSAAATAQSSAAAAQATADAALPKSGGIMSGDIEFLNGSGFGITFYDGSFLDNISDSVSTVDSTMAASATAVKDAYDVGFLGLSTATTAQASADAAQATADAAMPKTGGSFTGDVIFESGVTLTLDAGSAAEFNSNPNFNAGLTSTGPVNIGNGASSYTMPSADGSANYILSTDGSGTVSWVANAADGVQGLTGTAPITVDNTDPQNPIVSVDAASTTAAGVVQLNNTVSSTSTTQAATANAVKLAYDAALAAPLASATVLYVNVTNGNDTTGARGTTKPFATITAALAAALNGDTIFVAPGTYTESVFFNKGVNLVGTFVDQALSSGPKISGTFTVNLSGPATRNWAVSNFQFQAAAAGSITVVVSNNSFGSGGVGTFTNCFFQQFSSSSLTEQCFQTTGSWTRSLYLRNCTFDGNFTHSAGLVSGPSGYIVIDNLLGIAGADKYYKVTSGTCEFRNPSNALAPVLQTGGVVVATNVLGWTSNTAATTTIFGGTGFSYKGTSAGLNQAFLYLIGGGINVVDGLTWGKLSVGTNVVYAFDNVTYDTSLATLSGIPLFATPAVNPAGVTSSMSRPQWSYLTTSSTPVAASQLGVSLDATTGNVYTTTVYDAGTY